MSSSAMNNEGQETMTAARKTLGISRADSAPKDAKASFALTGARLETLKERAREQRRHPTDAQKALWAQLSGSKLGGVKFIRQSVVGSTIVDFACPSRWIVVQISAADGNADVNELQDRKLIEVGIRVLRFSEEEVLGNVETVIREINTELNVPFDKRSARKKAGQRPATAFVSDEG
ncbi:Very-short-patch-repair endonuclease [Novosphingobium panipatense]|jgi:leucyl-tRNA synthetase|uniref:Very-short-patch-repair endonuclease n=3 Tax=Sphingomonadaceae TaxID=41297 RepID=A0ABY1QDE3_9SPHN|nr:Very-short-patch-repair endonuclease [Novosphingobium panipatense]